MQKIFSARVDEAVLNELERATRKLGISKRRFLEEAIQLRARELTGSASDVWSDTLGAWRRAEPAAATIRRSRKAFQGAFTRHHRTRDARVRR